MIGRLPEELAAGKILRAELSPPEYAALDRTKMDEAARGPSMQYEKEYLRPDGVRLPVLVDLTRFTQEPLRWTAFVHDLTQVRRAGARAHEADRQLRVLAEAAPVHLFRLGPDLTTEYVSPSYYDYAGRERLNLGMLPSATGESQSVVHPDDLEHVRRCWREAVASPRIVSYECRWLAADGKYRWFLVRAAPAFEASGRLKCYYGASVDIHGHKEAYHELEQRVAERTAALARINQRLHAEMAERQHVQEQLRNLVLVARHDPSFIGIASLDGLMLFVNPAEQKMVGLESDHQVRTSKAFDYYWDEGQYLREQILPTAVKNELWEGETLLRHFRTHLPIPVEQRLFFIKDQDGRRVAMATVARDIRLASKPKRRRATLKPSSHGLRASPPWGNLLPQSLMKLISR